MRKYSPSNVQVKAAGGISSLDRLLEVRSLVATRVAPARPQKSLMIVKSVLVFRGLFIIFVIQSR